MVYFQTKNPNLGKFCTVLRMEDIGIFHGRLVYLPTIWNYLWPFGIFYGHLACFSRFGILRREKSGNPGANIKNIRANKSMAALIYNLFYIAPAAIKTPNFLWNRLIDGQWINKKLFIFLEFRICINTSTRPNARSINILMRC
jgi:hypothetical protein